MNLDDHIREVVKEEILETQSNWIQTIKRVDQLLAAMRAILNQPEAKK